MNSRQRPWPRQWLMTDERMDDRLWKAIDRLPVERSGIVFRHHSIEHGKRAGLARRIADIAHQRSLTLAIAGSEDLARAVGADLVHNPQRRPFALPFSRAIHSIDEADAAKVEGASLVFVSPVYPTRSHPDREALQPQLAAQIARAAGVPAIALGGMSETRFEQLEGEGFAGWAAIDAWLRDA